MATRLTLAAIKSYMLDGYDGQSLLDKYGYTTGVDIHGMDWTEANEKLASDWDWQWIKMRIEADKVASLLDPLPAGATIKLDKVPRAYRATYQKNEEGTWDQMTPVESPRVTHMDGRHLGFCVGLKAIEEVLPC